MKQRKKIEDHKKEPLDFISHLPDEILCIILSLLLIDEAVRSSILSKRWRSLWKYISHLDFDVKHMIQPLTGLKTTSPNYDHLAYILNLGKEEGISRYGIPFFLILREHLSNLTTCRFFHLPSMNVDPWIQLLVEKKKGLKDLTLECEANGVELNWPFPNTQCFRDILSSLRSLELTSYVLESAYTFETCKNMRTLKLEKIIMKSKTINGILRSCVSLESFRLIRCDGFRKIIINNSSNLKFLELKFLSLKAIEVHAENLQVLVLATLICPVKNLVLVAPNLRVLNCYSNRQIPTIIYPILKYQELLGSCSRKSKRNDICQNLSSLSIDLEVNNEMEALSITKILCSSVHLQTLRIIIPVNENTDVETLYTATRALVAHQNFSEGREISTQHKLEFVYIEGFRGTQPEVHFIRNLIQNSTKMKMITIICYSLEDKTKELWSLQSTAMNYIIKLIVANPSCVWHELQTGN